MPRLERSAGFILFRTSADETREYLLLDYGRHWDYVKGHVEAGEDDLAAAIRELKEETGLDAPRVIDGFTREIDYYFRGGKLGLIHKQVAFFIGESADPAAAVVLSHEHVGSAFLSYEAAMKRLTYATARELLRAAHEFLEAMPRVS